MSREGVLSGGPNAGSGSELATLREALAVAERRAATLAELTALMSQAHNPLALAQRAVELSAKATRAAGAYVYLWDRHDERLVLRVATEGWQRPHVGSVRLRLGEGITGWSALMRQAVVVDRDIQKDPRFKPFPELRESAFKSMVAVPIVAPGEEVLGVFTLYARTEGAFSTAEVNLAAEVGSLLANGLMQAETLTQLQVQSTAARFLHDVPDDAWGSLLQCLDAMAAQCAADMDAEVCVLEVTTDRTHPQGSVQVMAMTEQFRAEHPEVVRTSERNKAGLAQRLAELNFSRLRIPLAAATPIGAVTCYRGRRFAREDELLLESIGAQIAAGALSIGGAEHVRPAREQLIGSPDPATTENTLLRLGWKRRTTTSAILRVHTAPGSGGAPWGPEQMRGAFAEALGDHHHRFAVFGYAGRHLLLVETPDAAARSTVIKAIERIGEQSGVAVTAGVAPLAPTLTDLHHGVQHAIAAAQWAELTGTTSGLVVAHEDIAHLRLLPGCALSMSSNLRHVLVALETVVKYDLENGTDLAETLEAFLANSGSVVKAASKLFIHRNTLRQRLQRIEELIGQSPEGFDDWITAGLAVRLLRQSEAELARPGTAKSDARCPHGVLIIGQSCCGIPRDCPLPRP